ncbi:hypothetical protein ACIO3O_09985 [Streptomyces sp. NPDC087440]|uniref:hypothetical protein n=1 Tax=Streptomyces sp. NPDC087440 TaxID=3365790 RepID=UPI00380F022D
MNGTVGKAGRAAMGLGSETGAGRRASGPVGGRGWMVRGKDGRLSAYGAADGALLRWTETRPGGPDWQGPEVFPAPDTEGLAVAQGPDGFVHVVGRRRRANGGVEYVHATQYQSGRPLAAWYSLGSHPYGDPARVARMGLPAIAVGAAGAVHVFVRNGYGGVLMRRQAANGKWEGWKDLKGAGCEIPLTAIPTASGRVDLLAVTTRNATLHWTQPTPGAAFSAPTTLPFTASAGTLTGLETTDGELTYYALTPPESGPDTGTTAEPDPATAVSAHHPDRPPVLLHGSEPDSATPLAALRAPLDGHDCTILAHRTADGRPALAACRTLAEDEGLWWTPTGPECVGPPALAVDATGRVVMAVVATDGTLHVARQRTDEKGLSLAAWARV